MKKTILKYLIILIVLVISANMLSIQVLAADGTVTPVTGISVAASNASAVPTLSSGVVTITRQGNMLSAGSTCNITITNTGGKQANISFSYALSGSGTATLNGSNATTGTYSGTLDANGTVSMTLKGSGGWGTGTLTLSNFSWTEVSATATATVTYNDTKGSVTLGGAAVASGGTATVTGGTIAAVATPKSGCSFLGWVNTATNEIMNTAASATLNVPSNTSIQAVFVTTASDTAWFQVGNYMYNNLNTAANSGKGTTVILMNNGTLSDSHTIPSGVTLLIPYNSDNTLCTTAPTVVDSDLVTPTAFRTLTMEKGANIAVNGGISVSGSQTAVYPKNANVTGPVGVIKMNEGSSITVNTGGALHAWGYVAGSGTVTIKSGGTVYEDFQIRDYRGGQVTLDLANDATGRVFPLSQYYVQNVQVPMILEAGSIEKGYMSVTINYYFDTSIEVATVPFIGDTNCMFQITDGYITKDYDEATDRLIIDVNGSLKVNPYTITIKTTIAGTATIGSEKFDLPLNSNMTINLNGTSTVDLNQDLLMLPGSEINIGENATLNVNNGKRLIVYDRDQWTWDGKPTEEAYCSDLYKDIIPLANVYLDTTIGAPKYTRTVADLVDGKIVVNGTLDASEGYLYTTAGGGDICSTGAGQVILQSTEASNAYQIKQRGNGDDDFDSNTELVTHPITSAKLLNANTENGLSLYTETATDGAGTYYYHAEHKRWVKDGHSVASFVVTDPTCTKEGYTTYTCTCGFIYTGEVTPLAAHVDTDTSGEGFLECDHCNTPLVKLAAIEASADAETELRLKFLVHEELVSTATAQITFRDEVFEPVSVSALPIDVSNDGTTRYVAEVPIASGEMTCPVTVSFMDASGNAVSIIDYADNSVDTEVRRTVVDYAQRVLDISKNDQQKNLVQALVTYGGYAQIAFNAVDPDNPAYGTTPPSLDSVTADSFTDFSLPEKGSGNGITYDATNANLTSAISLRTFFALNGQALEDYTFYLTYVENRVEKTRALEAYSDDKTGRCFVDIERIPAAYFDYTYTISVKKNNVDMFQIQTSILGYLSEFINDSSTDANSNLAKAMYLYNQAANDFFGK